MEQVATKKQSDKNSVETLAKLHEHSSFYAIAFVDKLGIWEKDILR